MLKKLSLAVALLVGALIFTACPGGDDDPCADPVTYDNYVKTLSASKCSTSGCHDGTDLVAVPGDFRTYAGLKKSIDNGTFKTNIFDKNRMPFGQPEGSALPEAEIEKLECWRDAGYPEN